MEHGQFIASSLQVWNDPVKKNKIKSVRINTVKCNNILSYKITDIAAYQCSCNTTKGWTFFRWDLGNCVSNFCPTSLENKLKLFI